MTLFLHNKDDLSLVQLRSHFRIEESPSGKCKGKYIIGPSFVNTIKDGKNKNNESKGKKMKVDGPNDESNKKYKLTCWKCGKNGHYKRDCRVGKKNNSASASGLEQRSKGP
nr:hypothetical protein [Tanacetum cinerariifolium]